MLMRRTSRRGLGDANFVPVPLAAGGFDCGCGLTVAAGGTCPVSPATCQSISQMQAPAASCPSGDGVPTFTDGLKNAFANFPTSLYFGLLNLVSINNPNPGNVLAADCISTCYQATRSTPSYVLGTAAPATALIALAFMLLFGGRR